MVFCFPMILSFKANKVHVPLKIRDPNSLCPACQPENPKVQAGESATK
jgi:hypothetical protein